MSGDDEIFQDEEFRLLSGSPAPAVRWLHNETLMGDDTEGFILLETAVSLQEIRSELVLTNLTRTMSGVYTCKSALTPFPSQSSLL